MSLLTMSPMVPIETWGCERRAPKYAAAEVRVRRSTLACNRFVDHCEKVEAPRSQGWRITCG